MVFFATNAERLLSAHKFSLGGSDPTHTKLIEYISQSLPLLYVIQGDYSVSALPMELKESACKLKQQRESIELARRQVKLSSTGVTLVPQPSDDAKDPLVCPKLLLSTSLIPIKPLSSAIL